jgi:hypothetical protein
MAISFQSKDSLVLANQLSVQEVNVKLSDNAIVAVSANYVTVDVKETVKEVRFVCHQKGSDGSLNGVSAANTTSPAATQIKVLLSAPLAASDNLKINYIIDETP